MYSTSGSFSGMTNHAFCQPRPAPFSMWCRKLQMTLFSAAREACFYRQGRRAGQRPTEGSEREAESSGRDGALTSRMERLRLALLTSVPGEGATPTSMA